jgi:arylsulfatase
MKVVFSALLMGLVAWGFASEPAFAGEVTGTMGSPSARTTIDGRQLPAPDPSLAA